MNGLSNGRLVLALLAEANVAPAFAASGGHEAFGNSAVAPRGVTL
jgi:hypothetical protein